MLYDNLMMKNELFKNSISHLSVQNDLMTVECWIRILYFPIKNDFTVMKCIFRWKKRESKYSKKENDKLQFDSAKLPSSFRDWLAMSRDTVPFRTLMLCSRRWFVNWLCFYTTTRRSRKVLAIPIA